MPTKMPSANRVLKHIALPLPLLALILMLGSCTGPAPRGAPGVAGTYDAPVTSPAVIVVRNALAAGGAPVNARPGAVAHVLFQTDKPQVGLVPVADRLHQPLFVTHAGDGSGRLFVVEKAGTIRIVQDGTTLAQPFLDIRDRVGSAGNEQGLLGLAFAPNFAQTGHFFVNYSDNDGDTHISRFTANAGASQAADSDSEFTVLRINQPAANHNGGMLAFGADGYLYVGTGDGGGGYDTFGNGQNPATLLGKMLRIDVTTDPSVPYLIPPDNPWIGSGLDGVDVLDEIWAIGLRNPWRYSFDRRTGDLWIADVGQAQYEEVNLTPADSPGGLNYGWPIQEASHCLESDCNNAGLVQPVLEYGHVDGNCSITGGYVYRGSAFPLLDGIYFYGDYCSGAIWAATPGAGGAWASALVHRVGARISSFGEDEAGELYLTDLSGGTVYRVVLEYRIHLPIVTM